MKPIKLVSAFLMIFCMIFGILSVGSAAAYTLSLQATTEGSTQATQFTRGQDLYLNIVADNAAGIAGCAFTLNYPTDVLTEPTTDAEGVSSGITSIFPFTFTNPDTQETTDTHRENSSESGKIYFAGAAIDTLDGGALYDSDADVVLFTIIFKVKNGAPLGSFDLSLAQTELWNLDAGYGIDNNSNGQYDEGVDQKEQVSVLVGALDNQDTNWAGDLSDDFPVLLGDDTNPFTTVTYSACEVVPELTYTVAGTVSYDGKQTGTLCVVGFEASDPSTLAGEESYSWDAGTTQKAFQLSVPNGTYTLAAFIDSNASGDPPDATEAKGEYTTQITISDAHDTTSRDFSLSETQTEGIPNWWLDQYPGIGGANDDYDEDGYLNIYEYQNNTDPTVQDDPYVYDNYDPATDNRGPYQQIEIVPENVNVISGGSLTLGVSYNTTDDTKDATGIAIAIFYDSTKLTYVDYGALFAFGNQMPPTEVNDSTNADGDATTDKKIGIQYMDMTGNGWPGDSQNLPLLLANLNFTVMDVPAGTTQVNVIREYAVPGYLFFSTGGAVNIMEWNLDVDDSGDLNPYTDGLLIIRYLLDQMAYKGDLWITGAVDPNGGRTTAADIETYIQSLKLTPAP